MGQSDDGSDLEMEEASGEDKIVLEMEQMTALSDHFWERIAVYLEGLDGEDLKQLTLRNSSPCWHFIPALRHIILVGPRTTFYYTR